MKLKDEFVKLPKEMVYETYISIVYDCDDYDNITRNKMLDEILKEYAQENYLYYICTTRELDFLKYAINRQIDINDIKKYQWEIEELNKKCIFSKITYDIFVEQLNNVKSALKFYKNHDKKDIDSIIIFMISIIKINANMLTKAFSMMIESVFNIDAKQLKHFCNNPLFHFYCEINYEWVEFSGFKEEIISYRNYYDLLDELYYARKEYGIAGNISCDIRDNFDMFYYGFPIRKKNVKKMYDELNKSVMREYLFKMVDEARVLNNRHFLTDLVDNKLLKIINEALDEMPCAAMNGFTPIDYAKEINKQIELENKFSSIPQNNAHLCKKAADEYYKLYFALLDYINKKYKICPEIVKIYKQEGLDVNKLEMIDRYLWEHRKIIDDFIKDNNYNLNKEELSIIEGFKMAVSSDKFVIVGFEREYTKVLSEDGKIYMVKGIRADIDKLLDSKKLPKIITTTLLMFKGNIIFNSFFSFHELEFGNDIKASILNGCNKAMVYYHL